MSRAVFSSFLVLAFAAPALRAQSAPLVEDVEWAPLRSHCQRLMDGLDLLKAPLPDATRQALKMLLKDEPADPDAAAAAVQKLLDPYCLLTVVINPESRVKAARGAAGTELERDQERIVLVKVQNDAGSTAALALSGPELRQSGKPAEGCWLEAATATDPPLMRKLSGQRLEYVVVRLTARESGKREATFRFDVGQGTQDLGFRAEAPILFTVRAGK